MTEINFPTASADPSLLVGSILTSQELSTERIKLLSEAGESMVASMPEFMGMTLFGSTARGEARSDSDVDIFVFVNPDDTPLSYERVGWGGLASTVELTPFVDPTLELNKKIEHTVQDHGLGEVGLITLPLNEAIFEQTISELLSAAQTWDSGDHSIGAQVPRNIRALFHVLINNAKLEPFIERTLTTLSTSPNGNTAWKMIRHQVVGFELPKERTDDDYIKGLAHRHIPPTLDEAIQTYSGGSYVH